MRIGKIISLAVSGIMLAAAAAMAFSKKIHIREDGGVDADMYVPPKTGNTDTVFISNCSTLKVAMSAVKNYFCGKFFN